MTLKEDALKTLNLPLSAGDEEIKTAYQRLVHRYPPEFHPERFRRIDDSYRLLTSPAFLVDSIFRDHANNLESDPAQILANLPLAAQPDAVAKSMGEVRVRLLSEILWPNS